MPETPLQHSNQGIAGKIQKAEGREMKSIIITVVVVATLALAGIGGTLADFSDSEEELGDVLQAGSLDLKVDGEDDPNILPAAIRTMVPEKSYHIVKTVQNMGTIDGHLYIHVKNAMCIETNDKDLNGDGVIDELDKPEPEIVAEQGGKVGQKMVPGLGERCDMEEHIWVQVLYAVAGGQAQSLDLSAYDLDGDGYTQLDELECNQIYLGVLPACGAEYEVELGFVLHDVPEEFWGLDIFDETNPHEIKWNWWPTNCYQGDTVTFDVLFELLQTDYTPPGGN
jgi:predicted ribosomally synthesized peptide with SipW-like signal peptide